MYCCDARELVSDLLVECLGEGSHAATLAWLALGTTTRSISRVAGVPETLKGRSFTRVASWSRDELETLLDLADELKTERARRRELRVLPGRTIGLIFHKPSTRTRVAFEVGIAELGGMALFLPAARAPARTRGVLPRHGARPLPLPLRPHDPHLRPGGGRGVRRARVDPGHQRPHGRDPPAPGARRRHDAPRTVRPGSTDFGSPTSATATTCAIAHADRRAARDGLRRGDAAGYEPTPDVRRGRSSGRRRERRDACRS